MHSPLEEEFETRVTVEFVFPDRVVSNTSVPVPINDVLAHAIKGVSSMLDEMVANHDIKYSVSNARTKRIPKNNPAKI